MKNKIKIQMISGMIIALLSVFIPSAEMHAQDMYVLIGGGYGLSAAQNVFLATEDKSSYTTTYTTTWDGSSYSYQNSSAGTSESKNIKGTGSFGKGLQMQGVFGYMFNEHIGAELGIGYLRGAGISSKNEYSYTMVDQYIDLTNSANSYTDSETDAQSNEGTFSGRMIRFIPSLRISAGSSKVQPYAKAGLVIGMGAKMKYTEKYSDSFSSSTYSGEDEVVYSGRISFGFSGAAGVNYKLSDKIGIFAEAGIINQSWAPKRSELTKSTTNGVNNLTGMSTYDKETEYVDSYTQTFGLPNTSKPSQELKFYFPFSSAGINVGVHFTLKGKKASTEGK